MKFEEGVRCETAFPRRGRQDRSALLGWVVLKGYRSNIRVAIGMELFGLGLAVSLACSIYP